MNTSVEIDIRYAAHLQESALELGQLLIWSIHDHPSDYSDWFVARPTIIRPKTAGPIPMHLIAHDLDKLRAMLPHGLTRLEPGEWDDPDVIEVWV